MKSFNMRMTTVAVAMCLGLTAGSANAALSFGSWAGDNITGYTAAFSNNDVGDTFSDWFSFSLPPASNGTGAGVVISSWVNNLPNWNFFNVEFSAFDLYESANLVGSGSTGSVLSTLAFNGQAVPGNYSLNVAGHKITTTQSGGYSGSVTVGPAPVPEPETYAMLLAGIGLIGFTARRRKQNV